MVSFLIVLGGTTYNVHTAKCTLSVHFRIMCNALLGANIFLKEDWKIRLKEVLAHIKQALSGGGAQHAAAGGGPSHSGKWSHRAIQVYGPTNGTNGPNGWTICSTGPSKQYVDKMFGSLKV